MTSGFRGRSLTKPYFGNGAQLLAGNFYCLWLLLAVLCSCTPPTHKPEDEQPYKGPLVEARQVLTLYSDSAELKVKLTAPVQQEFENGDGVFPEGVDIIFFDEPGKPSTTLRANYGKFIKQNNTYQVTGNVVVKNLAKNESLNTEELFWDKQKKQVYTEKFVRIQTPEEILTGEGLRANQDFSKYRILKPAGIFTINP